MATYRKPNPELWKGRISNDSLYLHEKVVCQDIDENLIGSFSILGYACDEGVKRNHGRIGAVLGPEAVRTQLGKMPNHLKADQRLYDCGTIECSDGDMEAAQELLSEKITQLLEQLTFPIIIGGGHDIAYGHYHGIKNHVGSNKTIGIINFDAHFDLRSNINGNNSGTPFYQIADDCKKSGTDFRYLCLGIRKDANDSVLYQTAQDLKVDYIVNDHFNIYNSERIYKTIAQFIDEVDYIYTTIDLDGFSSAFAPGVSAPSPMGFSPDIALETLRTIISSKKLIGIDIAEMNPNYDNDNQTAKLAASLIHFVMHQI